MFDCLCPCCWRDHAQYFTTHTCTDTHTHRKLICWAVNWVSCGCGKTTAWTGLLSSRFNHLHSFSVVLSILSLHLSSDHSSLSLSSSLFCANCLHLPTLSFPCFIFFPPSFPPPLFLLFTQRGDWTQVRTPHPCSPSSKGTCQPTPTPLTTVGKKKKHTQTVTRCCFLQLLDERTVREEAL